MDAATRTQLDNLYSTDRDLQNKALTFALEATDKPVDWAYEVWDTAMKALTSEDNHDRAIGAQLLCNLAKSDPDKRILKDFDALLNVTRDERFVTARHCMQALWKVGSAGSEQQQRYMKGLELRFNECINEKNCTLIRYDILQSMRNVYDVNKDQTIWDKAQSLIETETDAKYRKKYATLWKKK